MLLSDFDYDLPPELIAQHPIPERTSSRLLVVDRSTGSIAHQRICELPSLLPHHCHLVFNNTKVIPARLSGTLNDSVRKVEIFLLDEIKTNVWNALVKPARKVQPGSRINFSDTEYALINDKHFNRVIVEFFLMRDFNAFLHEVGTVPLPPYIKRDHGRATEVDVVRYQTVFAKTPGAVAAPTAGLHFSSELLSRIEQQGFDISYITLHVGYGTFKPVTVERIADWKMEAEKAKIDDITAGRLNHSLQVNQKIVAVGTTTVRTLESLITQNDTFIPTEQATSLFIVPGFQFRVVNALLTNFHLPKSTLLMLVCAFANKELIFRAYQEAINLKYRFFSYGDAMLIL